MQWQTLTTFEHSLIIGIKQRNNRRNKRKIFERKEKWKNEKKLEIPVAFFWFFNLFSFLKFFFCFFFSLSPYSHVSSVLNFWALSFGPFLSVPLFLFYFSHFFNSFIYLLSRKGSEAPPQETNEPVVNASALVASLRNQVIELAVGQVRIKRKKTRKEENVNKKQLLLLLASFSYSLLFLSFSLFSFLSFFSIELLQ